MAETREILNADQASEYLGLKKELIYKLTHTKKIPFYKPTGHILFRKSELDEWVNESRVQPSKGIHTE